MSDSKGDRPDTPDATDVTGTDDDVTAGSSEGREAPDAADEQPDVAGGPDLPEEDAPSVVPSHEAPVDAPSTQADTSAEGAALGDEPADDEEPVTRAAPHVDTFAAPAGDGTDDETDPAAPHPIETPVETQAAPSDVTPGHHEPESANPADESPAGGTEGPADAAPLTGTPTSEPATGPRTDGTAGPAASGWRRLGAALRPRASRSQVLAGVLCAALGFALVVQVQQSASDQLSSARQEDLVRLLDEVTDRAQQLGDEVSGLEATRDELESGSGQARSALELAEQRAESEGILSGRLPAQGPGVRVTIQDPGGALKASQMFNVLEELRNAGAEVVELNGVRLVTSTWFEDEGNAIVVDGTSLSSPYEWTVIGDPETMDRALEIPGGALATVRTAGAEASTAREDAVKITAGISRPFGAV
ncbi:DUF881 domain-containing protein [Isoptericola sp. NPDC060257]|uniref:DUF881 domain-containing protein n=1 Tax=Isoptericola sp. NPDC060257 TaxID=3347087 RepID=UPI00366391D0